MVLSQEIWEPTAKSTYSFDSLKIPGDSKTYFYEGFVTVLARLILWKTAIKNLEIQIRNKFFGNYQ